MKIPAIIVSLASVAALSAANAEDGGRPLSTMLSGGTEIPGPGDPDGMGSAEIRVNAGQMEVCYTLKVSGIDSATGAHIHKGIAGQSGPVVVGLNPPVSGESKGCAKVTRELANAILAKNAVASE